MKFVGLLLLVSVLITSAVVWILEANRFVSDNVGITHLMVESSLPLALRMYRRDCGNFPSTEEGLDALLRPPAGRAGWKGPYLDTTRLPLDSWGHPYQYRSPGVKSPAGFDLWSQGPDPADDCDDIKNG